MSSDFPYSTLGTRFLKGTEDELKRKTQF
jgi:hypothetical protein